MRRRLAVLVVLGILLIAGSFAARAVLVSREARYLGAAFDIIRNNSIRRNEVDWDDLRARAFERNRGSLTRSQTHDTIRFVLESLGDRHSGLLSSAMVKKLRGADPIANPTPEGRLVGDRIGYVKLTAFVSLDPQAIDAGATRLAKVIRAVDAGAPCGWIVDLRTNGGGNMWPMIAGIGALLGEGVVGAFVDPASRLTHWTYRSGSAFEGDYRRAHADDVIGPLSAEVPIAVLLGHGTASSAEAVAIALTGRPHTRTFGERTLGLTTSNEPFEMSDGAVINLSVSTFADRTGRLYPNGIAPDEPVAGGPKNLGPLEAARIWISVQTPCAGVSEQR